jgi:hypothetical protein
MLDSLSGTTPLADLSPRLGAATRTDARPTALTLSTGLLRDLDR